MIWRYGLLGLPLAFVSLPLYVTLPHHYASQYAVPLATLGALLLCLRLLDAVVDPLIGRAVDHLLSAGTGQAWYVACGAAVVLAGAFAAIWLPPQAIRTQQMHLLAWLTIALGLSYLAYSVLSVTHQAWGTRWGGAPTLRARIVAWREGAALAGVVLASILPSTLGLNATSASLAATLVLGLLALRQTRNWRPAEAAPAHAPQAAAARPTSPWRNPAFRALLAVFMLNGIASATPATLLPFFVRDTLQAPSWEPLFLATYFIAAALGLPLWVRLIGQLGLAWAWLGAMLVTVISFCLVPTLGTGDTLPFELICLASGLALGADLAIPGALLTGVIQQAGQGGQAEGRFLGWWTAATKLNLALAAGLTLPLLGTAGYQQGLSSDHNRLLMGLAYGVLPCLFKLAAAATLWRVSRHHPVLKGLT